MARDVDLARLRTWFLDAEDASQVRRAYAERDRDYVHGIQLSEAQFKELERRGQPPVVLNRIRRKIEWLKGLEAQRRVDPKAFPRTPKEAQGAEAATDALRFVADNTSLDRVRSRVWDNMLVEGFGGAEVVHRDTPQGPEIVVRHYHWDRLFYDPHSREADFSDARYLGAMVWLDAETAAARYGIDADKLAGMSRRQDQEIGGTYDDIPRDQRWISADRKRVRIVLMWYRDGDMWRWCRFSGEEKIDKGESPYVDENNESVCPLILQSAYVDRNGDRHGVVRDMIDPQDEINKRRSKALFQSTARQVIADKGAVDSVQKAKREMQRPDGWVERNPDKAVDVVPATDQVSAHVALLQEAKSEIDMMGANSALAGETGESASGRAVLARQQGGMVEIASLLDQLGQWTQTVYRHMWMRVRQLWTAEKWVRVTDDERNARFVGFNQPMTLQEQLREMPNPDALRMAQQLGLVPGDPRLQSIVGLRNNVQEMDVDIILDEVPDQVSMDAEQFQTVIGLGPALVQANPGMAPVFAELLIDLAPGLKTATRDKLRQAMGQAAQGQMQAQAPMQEAEVRKAQAEAALAERQAQLPPQLAPQFQVVNGGQ